MNKPSQKPLPLSVKPARTFEEQAQRLVEVHGLKIEGVEQVRSIFSTVNYYRLSEYGKHLRQPQDPQRFLPGVTLEQLYAIYQFDMGMRYQMLSVLEFFEVQLRARIAYRLAIRYGSTGYMKAEHFRDPAKGKGGPAHRGLIRRFQQEVERLGDLPMVRHHNQKYASQFPVWVALELFSFGMLSNLFSIMLAEDQEAVCQEYGDITPREMEELIKTAVDVRNFCAHYNRLYNQKMEQQPLLPKALEKYRSPYLFPLILSLGLVMGKERVYRQMMREIAQLSDDFPQADLALYGFPADWEIVLRRL